MTQISTHRPIFTQQNKSIQPWCERKSLDAEEKNTKQKKGTLCRRKPCMFKSLFIFLYSVELCRSALVFILFANNKIYFSTDQTEIFSFFLSFFCRRKCPKILAHTCIYLVYIYIFQRIKIFVMDLTVTVTVLPLSFYYLFILQQQVIIAIISNQSRPTYAICVKNEIKFPLQTNCLILKFNSSLIHTIPFMLPIYLSFTSPKKEK